MESVGRVLARIVKSKKDISKKDLFYWLYACKMASTTLELSSSSPRSTSKNNKKKMDEDYHDDASYTSESEEVRVSPPKKRRRTIAASSTSNELVSSNDRAIKDQVASNIKKLKGKLNKNTQTKQYCTVLSQHFKLAKKEVIKAKDDLFDLSQNDRRVVQARGIHSSAVKELEIAREKADGLNKELVLMQEKVAREQVQWKGLSPQEILRTIGLEPTHDSLLILTRDDMLIFRHAMKRFGVRRAFHLELANNKNPAVMRKEICDVFDIPFDPEKEEPEKVKPQTTAEQIMKAARSFRLDESDDKVDSE